MLLKIKQLVLAIYSKKIDYITKTKEIKEKLLIMVIVINILLQKILLQD